MQETLDLMVLKTLESMGPLHGYGLARRIEQVSENTVSLNQGTIYPALLRLEQRKWVKAEWGTSKTGRSRQVLFPDPQWPQADRAGDGELGAHRCHHGTLPYPLELGGRPCTWSAFFLAALPLSSAGRQLDADLDEELRAHIGLRHSKRTSGVE